MNRGCLSHVERHDGCTACLAMDIDDRDTEIAALRRDLAEALRDAAKYDEADRERIALRRTVARLEQTIGDDYREASAALHHMMKERDAKWDERDQARRDLAAVTADRDHWKTYSATLTEANDLLISGLDDPRLSAIIAPGTAIMIATIRRDLAATQREAERLRHGQAIEGDYVCPNALERDRLREQVARLTGMIGRIVQEAKHHHAGKGYPLDIKGRLPWGLCKVLIEIERATEGESTDGR